jgi:hypothetical protein
MAFMNEQASGNKCVVRAPNSGKGDAETSKFLFVSPFRVMWVVLAGEA